MASDQPLPRLRSISYGGGVQSTALLVLAAQGRIDFPLFLMANVGDDSENPGTLRYVEEYARPFADRAAVLREEADRIDATRSQFPIAVQNGITWATAELRRHAAECPECGTTGACNGGPCPLRRMADETQPAEALPEENPARIDRLRPEFTEHASIEAIDAQLDRARRQERRWHLRIEWLISLRQARTEQAAAGARQDGAQP